MNISDFDYPLPDGRIAKFPAAERDASRLLVWRGGSTGVVPSLSRGSPTGQVPEFVEGAGSEISETIFKNIAAELPADSTLVFNDTRVVRARLAMFKAAPVNDGAVRGGRVEILCLEPHEPADYERAFAARGTNDETGKGGCEWRAMIGGAKKWKSGPVEIRGEGGELLLRAWRCRDADGESEGLAETVANRRSAATRPVEESVGRRSLLLNFLAKEARSERLGRREGQDGRDSRAEKSPNEGGEIVRFEWADELTFGQKLEQLGRVPIPPYLDRDTQEIDSKRYQTVYAAVEGSVAAPTAGLHFTPEILQTLDTEHVTLHVGAGTFLPVKSDDALEHTMHAERFEVSIGTVERLATRLRAGGRIVAVGTTSVRTLESLAILSYKIRDTGYGSAAHSIEQFSWREVPEEFSGAEALAGLAEWMRRRGMASIKGSTRIMITPGYKFRVVGGLITNFHQPKSTLLLLVSAFLGDPAPTHKPQSHEELAAESLRPLPPGERWREIYDYALGHGFRFLSYGDSSLLLP